MAVVLILCKSSRLLKLILRDMRSFCRTDTIVVFGRARVVLFGAWKYASIDVRAGESGLRLCMCPSKVSLLFLIVNLSFIWLFFQYSSSLGIFSG